METSETKQNMAASVVIQTAVILFGLTVYAAGVVLFILPLDMIAAGTTGLGLMAQHFFGIPLSGFVAVFNIIMFGLGWLELGKKFAATTLLATFYYPFILDRLTALAGDFVFTTDPMLCAIFAGIMIGFALGFVIRSGASTGGMDIPPLVLQKRFKVPVSVSMYVFDVAILLSQLLFRDREKILDMFEETCGGRLIQNYNCIGGVMADIHPNLITRIKDFIRYLPPMLKEYHGVFTGNIIARQRMKDIGILSLEDAISYGVTGPSGRASGWKCDIRKIHPYGVYDKVDFKEITYNHGDTFNRYMVRMDEIVESLHILEQLVDNIPEGDFAVKTKPIIKLPEGQYYKSVEAARGEFGVYIESHGDKFPYRVKFRSPGLPLVSVVDLLASNNKIADLIAIGGSLDYVVPDIDR